MNTEEKLDRIIALLEAQGARTGTVLAYETPELSVDQVKVDGSTVNRDGSVWEMQESKFSPTLNDQQIVKTPVQTTYGYFSQKKNPETWALMEAKFGDNFREWAKTRDPWTLYKSSPASYMHTGDPNWVTLMQFVLVSGRRYEQ